MQGGTEARVNLKRAVKTGVALGPKRFEGKPDAGNVRRPNR